MFKIFDMIDKSDFVSYLNIKFSLAISEKEYPIKNWRLVSQLENSARDSCIYSCDTFIQTRARSHTQRWLTLI